MKIKSLGPRSIVISFPELDQINLLAIYGEKFTYLCDTYLGPDPMEQLKKVFRRDGRNQPIIVFNSHWDWDHIWGNCAFADSMIIAHKKCRENLEKGFWSELNKNKQYARGEVKPVFPNILFEKRLTFMEDGVEFFYSPGHTADSASCYDKKENILYVGDNVEFPIPYIQDKDLKHYINTLKMYLNLNPRYIITGHGENASIELIKSNLEYVKKLYQGINIDQSNWSSDMKERHLANMDKLK
ncbi:hypothetical protein BHF71_07595 [Vulcanibacillus modesticaldus]|uniref:Metallo-beta-lactamase domain-containing protein n=1 Tax=Vulcanibacillus modesticaldus TaxID=337097 RepID=A0A1D2YVV0_9BACI|nr:MBL fold metallo-hydrolase [Vulcanibacillus modesticaldus]OEF99755.1 hypothetical protein BHF71_07595 [Vulcanibacillus modesticaldus]